ncbi:cytochrome b [Solimicrobium silvestre]|uniref:Cytochrome B561 n=1 Tax=Solimicrobium silvestre TaxID=2099400 RepID=A0A2S9GWH3_9BURK|nr:cytochrome b/b6 domain-containing protein [Solimicrobium silvestre]PRC92048.1 Cytochrome B561 [Solimicrobium silvestre]
MSRAIASRYQPVLVALHWLIALMIIGLMCVGFFVLEEMPNIDPKKLDILKLHMAGGMFVFVLMILRVIIRTTSARPAPAESGSPRLNRLASITHLSLYVIVFLMIATGFSTGYVIRGAFQPNGALPDTFSVLPTFQAHAILATLLALLITGHVVAALYHHFVLKNGLFQRMWIGKRTIVPDEK